MLSRILQLLISFWKFLKGIFTLDSNTGDVNGERIPGPPLWPLFGDANTLTKMGGPRKFLDYAGHLHRTYGHIVKTQLGLQRFVFIADPKLYKEAIRKEPRCPASFKMPASEEFVKKTKIPRGLFFMNGEEWYQHRQLLTQAILKETGKYLEPVFRPVPDIVTQKITKWSRTSGDYITSFEQDCYEIFLASISAICLGRDYEKYISAGGTTISELADQAIKLMDATFDLNCMPITVAKLFGSKSWKDYQEYTKTNLIAGRKIVNSALDSMKEASNGGTVEEFGLMHRFKNSCQASDEETVLHCVDFIFDVSDPVSLTTAWCLQAIGEHPEVQEKMLAEIRTCLNGADRPIGYEDLPQLPYLSYVMKEAQRVYPSAPLFIRVLEEALNLGGFNLEKDDILVFSTFHSHKSPAFFPNPEVFWPERWGTVRHAADEDAYHPFGAGKRICAGKLLALGLVRIIIANVVKKFEIQSESVTPCLKIMLYPEEGFRVRMKERQPL